MELSQCRAALYIRLSREDEGDGPSQSVSNQRALLEDYAKKRGIIVHDLYIDDGYSGTGFERPGFLRMLRDIEAKLVNLVITKDLSRLGRDYILTGHYMERYFPEHGVRYISLLDGIDTGIESSANEITPFRAIMNDMYAKDISKKITSVKREKQRRGLFIGGKAVFGYQKHPTEKNKIIIDEGAAPIVRRIFAMALSGESCRGIAAQLNREHIPTPAIYAGLTPGRQGPYTGLWSSERISELLQNETYIGSTVQGRIKKLSYKSKKRIRQPKEDWVIVENTHEAIIDCETFAAVQQLLAGRRRMRSRTHEHLLKGLIFCSACGCPLSVLCRKNAAGEDILYYVCRTYQRFPKAEICTSHCIAEKRVREAVLDAILERCAPYLTEDFLLPVAKAHVMENTQPSSSAQAALKKELELLEHRLDQMYLDKVDGILSPKDYSRLSAPMKERKAALQSTYRPAAILPPTLEEMKKWVRQFLEQLREDRCFISTILSRAELVQDGDRMQVQITVSSNFQ